MLFVDVGVDLNDGFNGQVTYQEHCVILVYVFIYSSKDVTSILCTNPLIGLGSNYSQYSPRDVRLTKEWIWQYSHLHTRKWYENFQFMKCTLHIFYGIQKFHVSFINIFILLCSCMVSLFSFAGQQTLHNSSLDDSSRVNFLHAYIESLAVALRYFYFHFHFLVEKLKGCALCKNNRQLFQKS